MLYVIILLLAFILLFVMEVMIPSGGVLGLLAGAALVAAVTIGFLQSMTMGIVTLAIGLTLLPVMIFILIQVWPRTPIGKRVLGESMVEQRRQLNEEYLGQVGVAVTDLLPNGIVRIGGKKLDAVSSGLAIDRGQPIVVDSVVGGKIHVTKTDRQPAAAAKPAESQAIDLETPVESLGIEDFDEPLR